MRSIVKAVQNASKINDWVNIQNEFDRLLKAFNKAGAIVEREGVPRFYIRALVEIDDHLKDSLVNKEANKKMNALVAKARNAMKQNIKKVIKPYEAELAKFRENPVDEEASEDEEAQKQAALEEEEEEAADIKAKAKKDKKVKIEDDDEEKQKAADKGFTVVGKGGKPLDLTPEAFFGKLKEIHEARGKKSTDKAAQVETLASLLATAATPYQLIRVLLVLLPVRFDMIPSAGYMTTDMWRKALTELKQLLDLLDANPHITLTINPVEEDGEPEPEHIVDRKVTTAGLAVALPGHIAAFVDRLDDEFTKSLQNIDPHSNEYIERLRDETILYAAIVRAQKFSQAAGASPESHDLMVMRRVEHIYFKPDTVILVVEEQVRQIYPKIVEKLENPVDLVASLCIGLYNSKIDRIRTRALLCHVYHLALHDQYHQARDMILMSHLQDTILATDIEMQILYNRAMVQIGLCAFRIGAFREAANALQDVVSSGRMRELLAQGMQSTKFVERTPEQERIERQRQLPFHMHVNLELLESVYLTSAMLIEVPHMALHVHDARRKVGSKSFRRMLDYSDRQIFTGPPENIRDHVVAASKAMSAGEWKKCRDYIYGIKFWSLLPHVEQTKEVLARSIQEETLRTYIFTYSPHYESLGVESLASLFELPVSAVTSVVSKMIINEELHASIDVASGIIVLHRPAPGVEMTRLEYLSGAYADKVSSLVEANEKSLEARALLLGLQEQQQAQAAQGGSAGGNGRGGSSGRIGGGRGGANAGAGNGRGGRVGGGMRFRTVVAK
ncbi:eukaryotic translation initiation factor 3 subunit 8 N-terminus-domain-containing protein [Entophlyctis helioformis]|nr:eukaryotic translation initiation factor 3 subunit 8 N-terminus-domain-containing protein [Entophlyctis helioformis]